jgi:hypothetical protein
MMMGQTSTPTESVAAILADPEKFAAKKIELERIREEGKSAHDAVRAEHMLLDTERKEFEYVKRKAADDAIAQAEKIASDRAANEGRAKAIEIAQAALEQKQSKHAAAAAEENGLLQTARLQLENREKNVVRREQAVEEKEKEVAKASVELEQRIARLQAAMR